VPTDLVSGGGKRVQLRAGQVAGLADERRIDVESARHIVLIQQLLSGKLICPAVVEGQRHGKWRERGGTSGAGRYDHCDCGGKNRRRADK
jgi:hypothetical protein